ncbi:host attachment protein [Falsiroseomonas tokyonensis]|uniref:Host attachment protein n=2 Tax=Falsiroseomonas tokyonensis TaxID=430521 RepID=A0ABV7C3B8_9PROT|nr:host attachment protein [Falsiroseomonas tokyonensis]
MPPGIEWALVANAGRARLFERRIPAGPWRERVEDAVEAENPPARERGTDRPGRVHESATTARHAIEPRTDPHRAAKVDFAARLGTWLDTAAASYQRLLLVAPPTFLGNLRASLGHAARGKLHGTLDKDLTQLPLAELAERLGEARAE